MLAVIIIIAARGWSLIIYMFRFCLSSYKLREGRKDALQLLRSPPSTPSILYHQTPQHLVHTLRNTLLMLGKTWIVTD